MKIIELKITQTIGLNACLFKIYDFFYYFLTDKQIIRVKSLP